MCNLNENIIKYKSPRQMFQDGQQAEILTMEALESVFGGVCKKSTFNEDVNQHIDLIWTSENGEKSITVDVKGLRKHRRSDSQYDESIHWIEFKNVNGRPGWLYGKATHIAFQTFNSIIFVKTDVLQKYAEAKIENKELVHTMPDDVYIPYQRANRLDVIMKIPTSDLIPISNFIIETNKKSAE